MTDDCRKHLERISEYLDGELSLEICREIESHLEKCPPCRACIESLRKTIQLCRKIPCDEMPAEVRTRLRNHLRACIEQASNAG